MRASLWIGSLIFVPFLCTAQQMPTWSSIVAGNVAEIEAYIQRGGDPNASVQSSTGMPVRMLKIALFDREQGVALALLRGGADFDSLDARKRTDEHLCSVQAHRNRQLGVDSVHTSLRPRGTRTTTRFDIAGVFSQH